MIIGILFLFSSNLSYIVHVNITIDWKHTDEVFRNCVQNFV